MGLNAQNRSDDPNNHKHVFFGNITIVLGGLAQLLWEEHSILERLHERKDEAIWNRQKLAEVLRDAGALFALLSEGGFSFPDTDETNFYEQVKEHEASKDPTDTQISLLKTVDDAVMSINSNGTRPPEAELQDINQVTGAVKAKIHSINEAL